MSKTDTGGPAFAPDMWHSEKGIAGLKENKLEPVEVLTGATWLDVCAWHAMQGFLSNDSWGLSFKKTAEEHKIEPTQVLAEMSYVFAQFMLAEKRRLESQEKEE